MRLTFIHTADWQIGKRFGAFPADKAAVLRDRRLEAVDRIAAAATSAGASFVLVAGDVLDSETLPDTLAGQLLSRLKGYPSSSGTCCPAITIRRAPAACGRGSSPRHCPGTCVCTRARGS